MKKCPYCAEEIKDEATKCKHCESDLTQESQGQENRAWYKKKRYIVPIVILFFAVIGFVGAEPENTQPTYDDNQQAQSTTNQPTAETRNSPDISVSAVDLYQAYQDNQLAAKDKYEGKTAEVSGVLNGIGEEIAGRPYVTMKGGQYTLTGVQCVFDWEEEESQMEKLRSLNKDRRITVQGTVDGTLTGLTVLMEDCKLINP